MYMSKQSMPTMHSISLCFVGMNNKDEFAIAIMNKKER